jgi:hypothetical protein
LKREITVNSKEYVWRSIHRTESDKEKMKRIIKVLDQEVSWLECDYIHPKKSSNIFPGLSLVIPRFLWFV